jgi:hypothetical protein
VDFGIRRDGCGGGWSRWLIYKGCPTAESEMFLVRRRLRYRGNEGVDVKVG